MHVVTSERLDGGIALVTLNRPAASNALSRAVRAGLAAALADAERDPTIGAIVLTGAGARAFSAGLDLRELGSDPNALQEVASDDPVLNPAAAVDACRLPVIGAINGVCVTGALEMALACDMLIAADHARFADTHAKVGLLPVWGLSQRLARVIGPGRARELSLSGRFIDAATAERWGLVNALAAGDVLVDVATGLAREITANGREAVIANKALMKHGFMQSLGDALVAERAIGAAHNQHVTPAMLETRRKALTGHRDAPAPNGGSAAR